MSLDWNRSTIMMNDSVMMMLNASNISMELPFCNVCDPLTPTPSYRRYNMVMTGILLPVIGLFGLIGNTLSAFVYTRSTMRTSMNIYLSALAISDICVITTAFFLFFIEGMRRYDPGIAYVFGAGAPYIFPAGVAAQTCSVYFTVAAAIDCFIVVVLPRRFGLRYCTVRRALIVIVLIIVLSLAYNVTHCFEIAVIDCWDGVFNTTSLQVCMTEFRSDPLYLEIYYVYLYTIVMAAGPLVVLIILNICIVWAMGSKKRKTRRDRAPNVDLQHEAIEDTEEESADVITLVLVVFLFIFCNSLALIINFLEQELYEQLGTTLNYLVDVSNLLVVCNSSANFIFYYAFGESFRRTFKLYFSTKRHRAIRRQNSIDKPNGATVDFLLRDYPPLNSDTVYDKPESRDEFLHSTGGNTFCHSKVDLFADA